MLKNPISTFKIAIPNLDTIEEMPCEDLAAIILETLNQDWIPNRNLGSCSLTGFISYSAKEYSHKAGPDNAKELVATAWQWLISEGFLAPTPDGNGQRCGAVFITKQGKEHSSKELVQRYSQSKILQTQYLHPKLQGLVFSLFTRGDYETAIFKSFKEVEITIRETCQFRNEIVGTDLMRKAFANGTGLLTDKDQPKSEQESIAHLFAGAHGYFRNPTSHRKTDFYNPTEAAEIIMLASFLLRTIEKRNPNKEDTWDAQELPTQKSPELQTS